MAFAAFAAAIWEPTASGAVDVLLHFCGIVVFSPARCDLREWQWRVCLRWGWLVVGGRLQSFSWPIGVDCARRALCPVPTAGELSFHDHWYTLLCSVQAVEARNILSCPLKT